MERHETERSPLRERVGGEVLEQVLGHQRRFGILCAFGKITNEKSSLRTTTNAQQSR